ADMARLLHMAKRVDHLRGIEGAQWERTKYAGFEQRQNFCKQPLSQIGPLRHELIGVDAEVAQVVAERAQAHPGVLVEIALAELEETTEGPQRPKGAVDGFAGQGIEPHIDARCPRQRENLVGEIEIA